MNAPTDKLRQDRAGWLTRDRVRSLAFALLAALFAWLGWLLVEPLAAPIAWALAFAVIAHPLHAWLARRLKFKSLVAGLVTVLVAVMLVVPATLAGRQVAREAVVAATMVQNATRDGRWHDIVERNPLAAKAFAWLDATIDLREQLGKLSEHVPNAVQAVMSGSLRFLIGAGVALFLLFFFLRDRLPMLAALRGLLPLSTTEAGQVFARVGDTIYAIFYGTLAVCLVQGALGALAFWWLGLPAPILWGSAMAVMAIVPLVGTAAIWGPAAVYLLLQGSPGSALLLAIWGFLVIGLVDNLLKPAIVQNRLRVHVVPVFIAILGGLFAFGPEGVIIGPVVLAVALALLDIWRRRVALEPA